MSFRKLASLIGTLSVLMFSGLVGSAVAAPTSKTDPIGPVEVSSAVYSDVSGPVSGLTGVAPA